MPSSKMISEKKGKNASSQNIYKERNEYSSVWRNLMHCSENCLYGDDYVPQKPRHQYTVCTVHFVDFISELRSVYSR